MIPSLFLSLTSLQIKNGPVFSCSILGSAVAPGLDFSFLKHNFGMSFIYCAGMVPATHTLIISNKGERGIRYQLTGCLALCLCLSDNFKT